MPAFSSENGVPVQSQAPTISNHFEKMSLKNSSLILTYSSGNYKFGLDLIQQGFLPYLVLLSLSFFSFVKGLHFSPECILLSSLNPSTAFTFMKLHIMVSKYIRLIQHINKIHLTPFKPTNPKHNCHLQSSKHLYITKLASLVMPNKDK